MRSLFRDNVIRRRNFGWLAATAVALLAILGGNEHSLVAASTRSEDLFSSNVVTLTSANWKEHVVDNPHMVLVNICRKG